MLERRNENISTNEILENLSPILHQLRFKCEELAKLGGWGVKSVWGWSSGEKFPRSSDKILALRNLIITRANEMSVDLQRVPKRSKEPATEGTRTGSYSRKIRG